MKKVCLLVFAFGLTLFPQNFSFAASEDEQWPIPNEYELGHHSVLIEEQLNSSRTYSQLVTQNESGMWLCKSVSDENCSKGNFYDYNAVLPVCVSDTQTNCIESLFGKSESGRSEKANFQSYTFLNHPNMFIGDPTKGVPLAGSPSIWKIPGLPHSGGDEYAIVAGLDGMYSKTNSFDRFEDFYMYLFPVSRKTGIYAQTDINGFENFSKCLQKTDANGRGSLGCGGGAQEFGNFRCAVKTDQNGDCYLQRPFPSESRFEINVRLAKEPIGWMHGRMLNPTIDIAQIPSGGVTLKVEAGAVKVPTFYYGDQFSKQSVILQEYWNKCLPLFQCGNSTRKANSNPWNNPNGNERNIADYAESFGDRAINLVSIFGDATANKSVAVPSSWNMRSLSRTEMSKANGCFSEGNGIKGIVTTNSTTYSEGPPIFKDGSLNYKVASAHYNPDGSEFKGTYNLVMRADVARCLYKFSAAPLTASIEVVSDSGKTSIATTVFGEKKGWVELAAYNFGFSAPTVKVKLSQEAEVVVTATPTPTPSASAKPVIKTVTITCIKGKTSKKVTAVNPKCPAGYKKK
jgi:hypothetical protein